MAIGETDLNPDDNLTAADKQIESAASALNYGGVESVLEAFDVFAFEITEGEKIIADSTAALANFDGQFKAQQRQLNDVTRVLPDHVELVESVRGRYQASALKLNRDADENPSTHEQSQSLDSVLSSCRQILADIETSLDAAKSLKAEGRLLQATGLLESANRSSAHAEFLLREIAEYCQALDAKAESNKATLQSVISAVDEISNVVADSRIEQPTIRQFENLRDEIQRFRSEFGSSTAVRDPFLDSQAIELFQGRADQLKSSVDADHDAYAEAVRAVRGAKAQLEVAARLVDQSLKDQIPDSLTIRECQQRVDELRTAFGNVEQRLQVPHNDWQGIDVTATSVNADLGVASGRLREELDVAQQAVAEFRKASSGVFRAAQWTGSYGIRVIGSPGAEDLDAARRALSNGDYQQTIRLCQAASNDAAAAIQAAEREVVRRRQHARLAAEAARRRQSSFPVDIFSGSSGRGIFGSGGTSGGSFSGGRSSSSGFSRSGW
jgi:hypothetical protein